MKYFFLIATLLFAQVAFTSKEGLLALKSFEIESAGIGPSGSIHVSGQRGDAGEFKRVTVKAFGKVFEIPADLLKKIPSSANGVQLTYENGWERTGGKTVYVIFLRGFTSGEKESVTISVNESGKFAVL